MPWCPKCQNEYKEGITECSECHVALVGVKPSVKSKAIAKCVDQESADHFVDYLLEQGIDSAESEENNADGYFVVFVNKEDEKKALTLKQAYLSSDKDSSLPDESIISGEQTDEEQESEEKLEELKEENDAARLRSGGGRPYMNKKDRYSDYASTAALFLVFGICGYVFVIMNLIGKLNVINGTPIAVIYFVIFSACIAIGVGTGLRAIKMKAGISDEQETIEKINAWLTENITVEFITEHTNPKENDEINYLNISGLINRSVQKAFPDSDKDLIEQLCEDHYNQLLPEEDQ